MKNKNFFRQGFAVGLHLIVAFVIVVGLLVAGYLLLNGKSTYNPSHASAVALPTERNFLRDGNFEKDNFESFWTVGKGGKVSLTKQKSEVHGGSKQAVKMINGNTTSASIQQLLTLSADQEYVVTGYFLSNASVPDVTVQVGSGTNAVLLPAPTTISDDTVGWKKVTTYFQLPLSQYKNAYNTASQSFSVMLSIQTMGPYKTAVVDDFKIGLANDGFSVIQNGNFENWKGTSSTPTDLYSWNEHNTSLARVEGNGSTFGVRITSGDNKNTASYLDQDVSRLVVNGGDYTVLGDVRGTNGGENKGWISLTQKIPASTGMSLIGEVNAMELAAADPAKPCSDSSDGQGNILRQCRKFFVATSAWTNLSQVFHVNDNASQVWVNMATYASDPHGVSAVDFDNIKLIYKPAVAPANKPTLISPINRVLIDGNVAKLLWNRVSNLGGNSNVDYYVVKVLDADAKTVFDQKVDQMGPEHNQIGVATSPLTKDGEYKWSVTAFNKVGQSSPTSDFGEFVVDTHKPGKVTGLLLTPKLSNNSLYNSQIHVTWDAVADANHYELSVRKSNGSVVATGGGPLEVPKGGPMTIDFTPNLVNGDYTVRLDVVDDAGNKRTTSAGFGYFADDFNSLDTKVWNVNIVEGSTAKVKNGQLWLEDRSNNIPKTKQYNETNILNTLVGKPSVLNVSVDLVNYTSDLRDSSQVLLNIGSNANNVSTDFWVGAQTNHLGTYKCFNQCVPGQLSWPMNLSLYKGTDFVMSYIDGQVFGTNFSNVTPVGRPKLGIIQYRANATNNSGAPDVSATFDNFRAIWVK